MSNVMVRVSQYSKRPQSNGFHESNRYRFHGTRPRMRHAGWLLLAILASTFMSQFSAAQVITSDIVGTVSDSGGAIVQGAKVTILNTETQRQRSMVTTSSGDYVFTLLPPGTYTIRVEQQGFKGFETKGVRVDRKSTRLNSSHVAI